MGTWGADGVVVVLGVATGDVRAQARQLVLCTAAALVGGAEREVRLTHEPSGRPRLGGSAEQLHTSVSHCRGGLIAVALSRSGPVGVDVEPARAVPALELARKWFAPDETSWLEALPADRRPGAFLWLWTSKEAAGKALGTGLRAGGTTRPVGLPEVWPAPFDTRLTPVPGSGGVSLAVPSTPAGAVLAVAGAGPALAGAAVELIRLDDPRDRERLPGGHDWTRWSIGTTGSTSAVGSTPATPNPEPSSSSRR